MAILQRHLMNMVPISRLCEERRGMFQRETDNRAFDVCYIRETVSLILYVRMPILAAIPLIAGTKDPFGSEPNRPGPRRCPARGRPVNKWAARRQEIQNNSGSD